MWLFHRLRRLSRDRQGAALVEFTLVAPLLIGLMCGLAEFGMALRQYHVMEKGVRDAARYLARVQGDPCDGAGADAWTSRIAEARAVALTGDPTGAAPPVLPAWSDLDTVAVTISECNDGAGFRAPFAVVNVAATAPYDDLGLLSFIGVGPLNISVFNEQVRTP